MDSDEVKPRLDDNSINPDRPTVWPLVQKRGYSMLAHGTIRMTKSVICQSAILEIATSSVIRHSATMATQKIPQLSEATRNEMTPERIGYRLMLLREALGLRPAEIADILDIERTYWSRFEGGKRAITEGVAAILVERFGVTLDFLILGRWDRLPVDLSEKMRTVAAEKKS